MSLRIIPIGNVVSQAQIALGYTSDDYFMKFRGWAYMAAREIGVFSNEIKQTPDDSPIPISNHAFDIPADMCIPIEFVLESGDGTQIIPYWDFNYYSTNKHYWLRERMYRDVSITQQGDQFIVKSPQGDTYTKAYIRYFGFPVNDQGDVLVPEYYVRAIIAFIEWMQNKSLYNRTRPSGKPAFTLNEINSFYQMWVSMRMNAEYQRDQQGGKLELETALKNYMSMLPNMKRFDNNLKQNRHE